MTAKTVTFNMQVHFNKSIDTVVNHTMLCKHCSNRRAINIATSRWNAYMSGESVDIALSNFPKYTRIFFTQHVCKRCQAEGY